MTTTDLQHAHPLGSAATPLPVAAGGPFRRIVVGSLTSGALAAVVLTLGVFPGAVEHVTSGIALLAFAAGWALLAGLTSRWTERPQRWAYVPAAVLATGGLALVTLAPGDDALTAARGGGRPPLLVVVLWSQRQARASIPAGPAGWSTRSSARSLLASTGALANSVALQREDVTDAMPGALYDVGGHRLHLDCRGTGSPTVVLENGLSLVSPMWGRITDATAGTTRVCAYDRAGQGWSDDAPAPQDSAAVTRDLHALLDAAGESGPFVLAGHSIGGVYALTYAARYPDQVAGLVLLDSASPHQFTVLPEYAAQYEFLMRLYGVLPTLTRLGIGRSSLPCPRTTFPASPARRRPRCSTARERPHGARRGVDVPAFVRAGEGADDVGQQAARRRVRHGNARRHRRLGAAQQQLAALSRNSDQRTVSATHVGVLDDDQASRVSVTAITDVVVAVRTDRPLQTS
jgi:pimeloyl-ACP methyl ester carboxylesterase